MELTYNLTLEDYTNLNKYSSMKNKKDMKVLFFLFLFFLFFTILCYTVHWSLGNKCFILSIFFYIIVVLCKKFGLKSSVKKNISLYPYMLDNIILKINNNSIIFKYDCKYIAPVKFNFHSISKIIEHDGYLYIFSNINKANILFFIPIRFLTTNEKNKILNLI